MHASSKLIQTYRELTAPVKASLWFLVCGFLQKGISFLTTPLFTRVMTAEEYGSYSTYLSWFGIIQIIVSMNLAAGVFVRGLVKNEEDQDRFSSSMLGLSTTSVLIWSVVYLLFHDVINAWLEVTSVIMSAMLLEIWAVSAFQFWSSAERVSYRYKKMVALTLTYALIRPVMGLVCIISVPERYQAEGRIISTAITCTLLFIGLYIMIMRRGRQYFNKTYWAYALKFNIPLIPHYLSQIVLSQADRIMINRICGATEAAYYSVAYALAMVLQILSSSVSSTMNPWIYRALEHKQAEKVGTMSYKILALIAVSNLLVVAVAPEILAILAPPSYQIAVWVVPPVTVSVYFMFLYNLFATFEFYFEKTNYVMLASAIGAVINIVLNAVCLPRFGFVAAGYTTLICYILYAIAHYLFMKRLVKKYLPQLQIYQAVRIALIGLLLVVGATVFMGLYNYKFWRYLLFAGAIICVLAKRKEIMGLFLGLRKKQID